MKLFKAIRNNGMWAPLVGVINAIALICGAHKLQANDALSNTGAGVLLFLSWIGLLIGVVYAWMFAPDAKMVKVMKNRSSGCHR